MSIRVTKANDMRGVFLPQTKDFLAYLAAFAVALVVGLTLIELHHTEQRFELARNV